jgi:hypothetical protein
MSKNYTVVELKKICKDKGIKGYSKMRKAELMKHCLEKKSIKKTPVKKTVVKKKVVKKNKEDKQCKICLKRMTKQTEKELVCGHKFHKNCIQQWFNITSRCPLCKVKQPGVSSIKTPPRKKQLEREIIDIEKQLKGFYQQKQQGQQVDEHILRELITYYNKLIKDIEQYEK